MLVARTRVIIALIAGMGWVGVWGAGSARASVVTLADKNSTADFETASGQGHPVGQFNWTVDTVDVLAQQWFWFRYGGVGPASSLEQLGATPTISAENHDFDLGNDYLKMTFEDATLKVEIIYTLNGGQSGSNRSGINELINIKAKQTLSGSLNFFQYVDFNLSDSPAADTLLISNGNTAWQYTGTGTLEETASTPAPSHFQADVNGNILNLFASAGAWNLNDLAGPVAGDVNWAFQWDLGILQAGQTRQISKTKYVEWVPPGNDVPEPATLVLFAVGGVTLLSGKKRRAGEPIVAGRSSSEDFPAV